MTINLVDIFTVNQLSVSIQLMFFSHWCPPIPITARVTPIILEVGRGNLSAGWCQHLLPSKGKQNW
jgi:hypothetical protein